jgi:hypothetical protein
LNNIGSTNSAPGSAAGPQHHVQLTSQASARHQDEALENLGELVAELHCDAPAERMPDDGGAAVAEREQQVPNGAREGPSE